MFIFIEHIFNDKDQVSSAEFRLEALQLKLGSIRKFFFSCAPNWEPNRYKVLIIKIHSELSNEYVNPPNNTNEESLSTNEYTNLGSSE